jgi:beta-mannosidase
MTQINNNSTPGSRLALSGWRMRDDNPNEWQWGNRARRWHNLEEWLPVDVPGSVHENLLKHGLIPHPYYDLNSRAAEWTEHRDWIFGLDFSLNPPPAGQQVFLEFSAVDDACLVYLNGQLLGEHEGPGGAFDFEIGSKLQEGGNQLIVIVKAAPYEDPQIGHTENTRSLKGRMGYGWDFAPRLVRTGIMGPVYLHFTGKQQLYNLWAWAELSEDLQKAKITFSVDTSGTNDGTVRFTLLDEGQEIAKISSPIEEYGYAQARLELANPKLWWPNGSGDQPLYKIRAELEDGSDWAESVFGIREIKWVGRPDGLPEEWPFTLVVNEQRIFQKGWNWVPADAMGGAAADKRVPHLLRLAQEAGVNMLRCWGGADPESELFYSECDRLGLLVWQEFPLSSAGISNLPPSDPEYLRRLRFYAEEVICARRNHPSLALWGGGNELMEQDGRPLTLEHPYAKTLKEAVREHDFFRQFRPSSPLGPVFDADPERSPLWDVHGAWEYSQRMPGPQYWRLNAIRPLLHSELGLPGESSLETLQEYLSPEYRSRKLPNIVRRHHSGAWWEHQDTLEQVFGPFEDTEEARTSAILASQWLQADGLRYYIEETRRRWPTTAGIFPWQLNEPWPNVVCTSAVEYSGRPKLAYFAVKQAYRPILITARYEELHFPAGQPLKLPIFAINDGPAFTADFVATLTDLEGRELATLTRPALKISGQENIFLEDLELALPQDFQGVVVLDLKLGDTVSNRYLFSNLDRPALLRPVLAYPRLLTEMFRG